MISDKPQSITWVILAGGRGQRMSGQDKGLLQVGDSCLVELIVNELQRQILAENRSEYLLINANRNIATYQKYAEVVTDLNDQFQGPLSGMLAALMHTKTEWIAVIPCDSPNIPLQYVEKMVSATDTESDVLVAFDGEHVQPVFCLIRRSIQSKLEEFLRQGERKVGLFFRNMQADRIDFSDNPELFVNINHPEDLAQFVASRSPFSR
ncbi:molybdenum cofactor guanylyltransferase MobA [Vibrio sp. RC27]